MDVINAQQARIFHNYKNTIEKLLEGKAAVCFNKMCRLQHLIPKYIQIKVNGNNKQIIQTRNAAVQYRTNQELKILE